MLVSVEAEFNKLDKNSPASIGGGESKLLIRRMR